MSAKITRIDRDFQCLKEFNASPGRGLTRLSYTKEYRDAMDYLKEEMEKAGMSVRVDAVGNLIGRVEGTERGLGAIGVGSHLDSVRGGGFYDGDAGIVCGLEIARMLREEGVRLRHPYEVIAIVEEEGNTFGSGIMGGKAISGMFDAGQLDTLSNEQGQTIRQAMETFGLEPDNIGKAKRSKEDLTYFIEPHIEQGPVLESEGFPVGVVDTIVGIRGRNYTIFGQPDHAGTTPMALRKDAMVAASHIIVKVNEMAKTMDDGTVTTCGRVIVEPGAPNVVPGKVELAVECRSKNQASIDDVFREVERILQQWKSDDFTVEEEVLMELAPTHLSGTVTDALISGLKENGLREKTLPSGAGHDSMCIAQITDVGMIFLPSKDGRSHCPEEFTKTDDIRKGCDVVYSAIMKLDQTE